MIATHLNISRDPDRSGSTSEPRNWKGIGLALLVISLIFSLIVMSVVILTPDALIRELRIPLSLDDIKREEFQTHEPDIQWVSARHLVFRTREGQVTKQDVETQESEMLVGNGTFLSLKASRFQVSPDLTSVLLTYNIQQVYRYSFTASYAIYNIQTREVTQLRDGGQQRSVFQYAAWGARGSQLVYILENNIYYQATAHSPARPLTTSGEDRIIFNGIADWVYEEELLKSSVTHWWSPDGTRLAYAVINDSDVPNMQIPQFLGTLYPVGKVYPYPKAGQRIPTVRLFVVNLSRLAHTLQLIPVDSFKAREYYITMVRWVAGTCVAVRWLTRAQDLSILTLCDATNGVCVQKHSSSSDTWLTQQNQPPLLSPDGETLFLITRTNQGGQRDFQHLAMFVPQGTSSLDPGRFITSGDWDVTSLNAYHDGTKQIYFQSTEASATSTHLYSADTHGSFERRCVTCDLLPDCSHFQAEFSPDCAHFALYCKGPGIPRVTVHQTTDPRNYYVLEANNILSEALEGRELPVTEFRTVSMDGYNLQLKLSLPRVLSESSHPLLLLLPEEPGSDHAVTSGFSLGWETVISAGLGVVVAEVGGQEMDNRTPRQQVNSDLGAREVTAVEALLNLPFVDRKRVGVYGKGYGGYSALRLLATERVFECAAAVAPITDFRLFAAVMSERILGLPSLEDPAYTAASLLEETHKLGNRRFLVAHGTGDARVHFQHTAELLRRLIRIQDNYTAQIYPDEGHFFLSERNREHLERSIVGYFQACFGMDPDPDRN